MTNKSRLLVTFTTSSPVSLFCPEDDVLMIMFLTNICLFSLISMFFITFTFVSVVFDCAV